MLIKINANRYIALATRESIVGDVIKTGNGNGERRTKTGNGKMKNENNRRIRIEVTDGAKVQVSFCYHFFIFLLPTTRSSYYGDIKANGFRL